MVANAEPLSVDAQVSASSAKAYWSDVPPTVDGMLGGYPQISRSDLRGSHVFVSKLRRSATPRPSASASLLSSGVDCGAGIGRVTAGLLTRVCSVVDVVEPVAKFAEQARALPPTELGEGQIGKVFVCGLEDWYPDESTPYDLIWHQWCLGNLNNSALDAHLCRCTRALRPGGWIVAKENISWTEDIYDEVDSSVTRTDSSYRAAFEGAGLKVVRSEVQKGFPPSLGLYPVRFYALQPQR